MKCPCKGLLSAALQLVPAEVVKARVNGHDAAHRHHTGNSHVHGNAGRREDGNSILIPSQKVERNRDNPDGRNHLCAPPPALSPADTVHCFALGSAT